jgi:hypothetical protein
MSIDGIIFLREPSKVSYHRELVQLGQIETGTDKSLRHLGGGDIRAGQGTTNQARTRKLEYERFGA